MFLPSILERRLKISVSSDMYAVFVIFLYGAIYLGEVRSYYFRFPHWDLVLHSFSGLMTFAPNLNDSKRRSCFLKRAGNRNPRVRIVLTFPFRGQAVDKLLPLQRKKIPNPIHRNQQVL
ncbi:MAG: hypothetical protein WBH97_04750 [Rectinemataceae bacterium]